MTTMVNHKFTPDIPKAEPTILTFEVMKSDVDLGDANYKRKVQLLNDAMQEVGMGRYQWYVFRLPVGFWICAHEEFMQGPFRRHWVRLFLVRSIGAKCVGRGWW
jgi:hypothetical protein